MTPENKARLIIDKKLIEAGYILQDKDTFNPAASLGVVVREFSTKSGPVDYLIFINKKPVGVIEAKESNLAESLHSVAEQSKRYAESGIKGMAHAPFIRFTYEATDQITHFCDYGDIKARSREIFTFHKPETLAQWLTEPTTLRNKLRSLPPFDATGFRKCQSEAIANLEKSFAANHPRALIQMATGAGKTFTAITSIYRLLKFGGMKRILFLVDTKNLGEQAEEEFRKYKPNDDAHLFPELYDVCRLKNSFIPESTHVCISTIQRMYSILCNKELDENAEEISLNELNITGNQREVSYNSKYPPEFFDCIIIDECHRSIYNIWQQVLDYFDAYLVGLTATPDNRTFAFFQENVVSEYSHEEAVLDHVNVGREGTYTIETKISQHGGVILKQAIETRNRLSRLKRWSQLDEDLEYAPSQLDRSIVNPSQIRHIIKAFKQAAFTELFPQRKELPKTLIFAKTDSHADDIIKIVREEFAEGNDFCKKVTYGSKEDPKSVLASFRNDFYPRIAVTVDMIATGTDVRPIECLLFMRDVRSRNYYEQMLGRATRTLDKEGLQRVSPSATEQKMGYVLVDAVGVTTSQKGITRQLERQPSASLKDLLMSVTLGSSDEDTLSSLANRFIRLDRVLTEKEQEQCAELTGGVRLSSMARNLLNTFDEDLIAQKATKLFALAPDTNPTEAQYNEAQQALQDEAIQPIYNPELRDFLINARKTHDQIIDNINLDEVTFSGWDEDQHAKAQETITNFRQFIEDNKDSIDALQIIYNKSYKTRALTFQMIEELHEKLLQAPHLLSSTKLWAAYTLQHPNKTKKRIENKLADIISLVRFELQQNSELAPFATDVNNRFKTWVFQKNAGRGQFSEEEMEWLRMIREHIAISAHISIDDLDLTPFSTHGGLAKFYRVFGNEYETILHEINYALVA